MAEEIDPVNQRVAELLSYGVPEQDIVNHLSQSKDESHKLWVQKWKSSQTAERAAERIPPTEQPVTTELQRLQKLAEENPITTAAAATAATAAAGLGTYAIKSRMDTAAKIREAKALAKLEPSEAVKIQREQLDLAKQKFQAEQDNLIKFENNKAIVATRPNPLAASFEQKFGMPLSEAEKLSGGKIANAIDAEIIGNTLTKGQGLSVNPIPGTVSNQPAGIPSAVNPMDRLTQQPPTPQMIQSKAVAPTAVDTLAAGGTPTQIATQTAAQEIDAIAPVLKTQSSGVNQYLNMFGFQKKDPTSPRSLAAIDATNKLVEQGFQGVAPKGASGNPEGYRNQYIPFVEQNANTLAKETQQHLNKSRTKAQVATVEKLIEAGVPLSQQGHASIGGLAGMAMTGLLGKVGYDAYKHGEKTGDWKPLQKIAVPLGVGLVNPAAGMAADVAMNPEGYQTSLKSTSPLLGGLTQYALEKFKSSQNKAGAGRGIAPPSAYQR